MPIILLAVLAGIVTVGAPCILPMLPLLLATSVGRPNKTRPFFIVLGFIIAFSFLGIVFGAFSQALQISQHTIRNLAIGLLAIFGLFMVWPVPFELLTRKLNGLINKANQIGNQSGDSNWSGFVMGLVLGVIWTPCAGPVLGTILTLIISSQDIVKGAILLVAYAVGAGIPMLIIAYGGQYVTTKVRVISRYTNIIQKIFGIIVIALAVAMFFQYDTLLQAKLLEFFPAAVINL